MNKKEIKERLLDAVIESHEAYFNYKVSNSIEDMNKNRKLDSEIVELINALVEDGQEKEVAHEVITQKQRSTHILRILNGEIMLDDIKMLGVTDYNLEVSAKDLAKLTLQIVLKISDIFVN